MSINKPVFMETEMTIIESSGATAQIVEDELRNLESIRENPPSRADVQKCLPQANGDQDTW